MPFIEPTVAPVSLAALATRVRASSNFRFSWQWFSAAERGRRGVDEPRHILGEVIARPECHSFLAESAITSPFTIEPLHEHVGFAEATGSFEQTLARAAADQLGAYSRVLAETSPDRVTEVRELFSSLGPYRAFELTPGQVQGCATCKVYNNHLFTSWFYGVAWDWLFLVQWSEKPLVWLGCLSDTD